jgi:hypothetical protein
MYKRTNPSLILLAGLFVSIQLCAAVVKAQDIIPADKFLIRNKTGYAVTFSLRQGAGRWDDYYLSPGADSLFGGYDQIWFCPSGVGCQHLQLRLGQRYKITFDGASFHFVMITPDQWAKRDKVRPEKKPCDCAREAAVAEPTPEPVRVVSCPSKSTRGLQKRLDPRRLVPAVGLSAVKELYQFARVGVGLAVPRRHAEVEVVACRVADTARRRVSVQPLDGATPDARVSLRGGR